MHTLAEMDEKLNRPVLHLRGLQRSFKLPAFKGAGYSDAYLAFLETVVALRTLNIPEKTLVRLWRIERKLMRLLNVDSASSPTWFLDSCGPTRNHKRRLLLSNFDTGAALPSGAIQLGLAFTEPEKELFTRQEMGEDALEVLKTYLAAYAEIHQTAQAELPRLFSALSITKRFAC